MQGPSPYECVPRPADVPRRFAAHKFRGDRQTKKCVLRLILRGWSKKLDSAVDHVALSGNGRSVTAAGPNWVRVWDTATQVCIAEIQTPELRRLAISAAGDVIAFLSLDGVLTAHDLLKATSDKPYGLGPIRAVAFSPIGSVLAVAEETGRIGLIDYTSRRYWPASTKDDRTPGTAILAFDRNSERLLTLTEKDTTHTFVPTMRWATLTGDGGLPLVSMSLDNRARVTSVAFTKDSEKLVSGSDDRSIRVFDVANCELQSTHDVHDGYVRGIFFSPDEKRLYSIGEDCKLHVFECPLMTPAGSLHIPECPLTLAVSGSGLIVMGTREGKLLHTRATPELLPPEAFRQATTDWMESRILMLADETVIVGDCLGTTNAFDPQGDLL
jgi:hypothetical protein